MSYTDRELKESTQVAYLDLIEKSIKNKVAEGNDGPFSIRELISSNIDKEIIENNPDMKLQELAQLSDLRDLDKEIISRLPDEVLDWKIVDIHDMTQENGFFGCVIETSDKEAIVAFRGSEGLESYSGLVHDWMEADFGLLNASETKQQKETEEYADGLIKKGVLDKYKSIAVAGHSLGGNLASHFAVVSGDEKRKEIFDKINQVINFDGPGVSNEYLKAHEEQIKKVAPKIQHYKWSLVGSLLYDLPGEKKEFLKIGKNEECKTLLDKIKYRMFLRHHTKSLVFDENGNAERGRQDITAKAFEILSRTVEKIPSFITQGVAHTAAFIFDKITYEKADGTIGFKSPFSNKEKYQNYIRSAKIKCGDMINGFLTTLQSTSKVMENYYKMPKTKQLDKKNGYMDFMQAAVVDRGYNMTNIDNIVDSFRNNLNMNKSIEDYTMGEV